MITFGVKDIMLTRPCKVDPLTPHFFVVNRGIHFFLIFAPKHRSLVRSRVQNGRGNFTLYGRASIIEESDMSVRYGPTNLSQWSLFWYHEALPS